jgi:hypothetical protein
LGALEANLGAEIKELRAVADSRTSRFTGNEFEANRWYYSVGMNLVARAARS